MDHRNVDAVLASAVLESLHVVGSRGIGHFLPCISHPLLPILILHLVEERITTIGNQVLARDARKRVKVGFPRRRVFRIVGSKFSISTRR